MNILICGDAGYIGSHMLRRLLRDGHGVVMLDNLSSGHRAAVQGCELVVGDLLDAPLLERVFVRHRFDAVMHFGAKSLVAESVREPDAYHRNNVDGTRSLLASVRAHAVQRLVFSSTAALCGMPLTNTIDEDHPRNPISPYGRSKMMVEDILRDAVHAHGLRSVSLRYFNAAGASADASIGEAHEPETHLIPNVLRAAAAGAAPLPVYGTDYPTRDGTCVRDYVHVEDLADAHLAALAYLAAHDGAYAFNLGNGAGFSVLDIVRAAGRVTECEIPWIAAARRDGDPATLVANCDRAHDRLSWQPRHTQIKSIIDSAWRWHRCRRY